MYDKANVLKQKNILSKIVNINSEIGNEFEAQRMIYEKMKEYINDNNFENFSVNVFVNDDTKKKWKSSSSTSNEFIKIFYNEVKYASELYNVSKSEISFLYTISEYLLWESNLLVDKEGKPMNQKALVKELGMSRQMISKIAKELEKKKCLIRIWDGKDVYFIVNPYLIVKGQKMNKGISDLFNMIEYIPMSKNKKKQ